MHHVIDHVVPDDGLCQTGFTYRANPCTGPLERWLALVLRPVRHSLGEGGSFGEGGCEAEG